MPQYLTFPDLASAQARSAEQAKALGCDSTTPYWWAVQPLTDGTAAIVIDTVRADFAAVHPKGLGLTSNEIKGIVTEAVISPKLPSIADAMAEQGKT